MVLETAVNGDAAALVTFNLRHFRDVPARFGIELLMPAAAAVRIDARVMRNIAPMRWPVRSARRPMVASAAGAAPMKTTSKFGCTITVPSGWA